MGCVFGSCWVCRDYALFESVSYGGFCSEFTEFTMVTW